jgi:hypothetical protein
MGSTIHLSVGRLELDWGKNAGFTDHSPLFQVTDVTKVPYYYVDQDNPHKEGGEPYDYNLTVQYKKGLSKPLAQIIDRINLLGHTRNMPSTNLKRWPRSTPSIRSSSASSSWRRLSLPWMSTPSPQNGGRHQIRTGGRLQFGMPGRHRWNPHLRAAAPHRGVAQLCSGRCWRGGTDTRPLCRRAPAAAWRLWRGTRRPNSRQSVWA